MSWRKSLADLFADLLRLIARACVLAVPSTTVITLLAIPLVSGFDAPTLVIPPWVAVGGTFGVSCVLGIVYKRQQHLKRPVIE